MQAGRRWLLWIVLAVIAGTAALFLSYASIIGSAAGVVPPPAAEHSLSAEASRLIDEAYRDIEPGRLKDYHVHIIGMNRELTGAWVDPALFSWWGLHKKVKGDIFIRGSGVTDLARFDQQYVARLVSLIEPIPVPGKYQLLAFDYYYAPTGARSIEDSELYVPNEYVVQLTRRYPQFFTAAVSVHPYRRDAVQKLEYWAERGVRFVKWLPNAQGMRPDDPRLDDYYAAMIKNNMVLLTHVGAEYAISSSRHDQSFGNPQRFIPALEKGVTVVMAHAASAGQSVDAASNEWEDNFELFMRLMQTTRYESNLFGDISALTQFNRLPGPLARLLEQSDIHSRLINGSDYPLPAINVVISTWLLAYHGFISDDEKRLLDEIYQFNPLLFDFVTKRTLRHPVKGNRFPPDVFMINNRLESVLD